MIPGGIIDKDFKIKISTSCVSDAILDDNVNFVTSDKSNPESPQRTPIQNQLNVPVIENTPVITSQKKANLPINTDKLGKVKENMMATMSTFMNEIYELKKEISLLQSLNDRNESKESENSHTSNVLETKLVFLEKENSILRSEIVNKQKIIDSLLETNISFFKSIRDPSSVVIQDSTSADSKISNGIHEINRKKTNPTYKSEQIMTTNKSNPKSVPTKNSVIIVGDSIVKHLTGPGISKKNNIKIKTNPGATTEDIIDYIKPSIRKKPDFLLVHSGTNDLTNGINTMTKIRKVLPRWRKWIMKEKLSWVFLQLFVGKTLTKLMKL